MTLPAGSSPRIQENEASTPNAEILEVDLTLRGPVAADVPDLLARADLIVSDSNGVIVRDFKTSRTSWNEAKAEQAAPQLVLYGHLASQHIMRARDMPIRLEFCVLTKHKHPRIETHAVPFTTGLFHRATRIVQRTWQAMRAGHIYPNPSPLNCASCPYQQACRQWDG